MRLPRKGWSLLAALAVGASLASGCGAAKVKPTGYAEEAQAGFEEAERALDRGEYEAAREGFGKVADNYPMSEYAALSELRLADVYYEEGSYVLAADAYRRFVQKRPTHARAEEAELKAARCVFEQMPGEWWIMPPAHERELASALEVYRLLRRFVESRPDSSVATEAQQMLTVARDRLADHELFVAEFYAGRENPRAAARRLVGLLRDYPEATRAPKAAYLLASSYLKLGDGESAVEVLRRLADEHGESRWGREARAWLSRHGTEAGVDAPGTVEAP